MSKQFNNFIAGQWTKSDHHISNINPSDTSDEIGRYAQANSVQLNCAIESAKEAQRAWGRSELETRYQILMTIGETLQKESSSLGELLSREEGKPIAEGKGEVFRAGQFFTYYAAEVLRQMGQHAQSTRPNIEIEVKREPVGVVAVISPWNFPTATAAWKIAPALAYGNAVIWKPANLTPASAVALTEIIAKSGLPDGVFNLVMGSGSEIGNALCQNTLIDAISFTGSVPVGRQIAKNAIEHMCKIQMEMGSKNALIVMDDCDMDLAVANALGGAFGGTGQKCTASSRLIVHEKIHDEFVEKLTAGAKKFKVGHALEEGTQMGPVVSEAQLTSNLEYIEIAKREGGEILCGGSQISLATEGYYMSPAVIANTKNSYQINRDEMFAPITCVIKVNDYTQALNTLNDTDFGLTAGIMTRDLATANHFKNHAQTGCVMVNLPTAGTDYHVPFGGRGDSSYGSREQGKAAEEFYTTVKTSYIYAGTPKA